MKRRLTILGIVLIKNEKKNLPLCLKHLEWIDNLIIVDSGEYGCCVNID